MSVTYNVHVFTNKHLIDKIAYHKKINEIVNI